MSDDFSKYVKMCFEWGDESILEVLLELHGSSFGFVLKRKFPSLSTEDLDGAILEALDALWRYKDRFDPEKGDIAGWFFAIASKKASDLLKAQHNRRREKAKSDFSRIFAAVQSAEADEAAELQLLTVLHDELNRLSKADRDFLFESIRTDVEGYTPQMAAASGTPATLRREKNRLRKKKSDLLKRLRSGFMGRGYNPDDERRIAEIKPKVAKVLLAEDYKPLRMRYMKYCAEAGAEVTDVSDGQAARDEAMRAQHSGQPYGLIMLDIDLPKIMGNVVAQELRDAGCNAVILGFSEQKGFERCCKGVCNQFLPKPLERERIHKLILQIQ